MFWSIVGRVVQWILVNWHVIHCCCRRHHGQDQHQDHRESTLRGGGIGLSLPWRNGNCRIMNNGPWQWRFDAWTESNVAHFLIVAMRGSPMRSVVATNNRTSELRAIYGTPLPPPNPFRTIGWKPNISTWTVLLHSSRNGEERKGTVAAGHVLNVTSGFVACAVIRGTYRPPNLMQVDRAWACVRKYGTRY